MLDMKILAFNPTFVYIPPIALALTLPYARRALTLI
jgi:hypothetical protein